MPRAIIFGNYPRDALIQAKTDLKAAQRELIEETGYRASRWRRILKFYASPGFMAETMAVYLATGLQIGIAEPEEDEIIRKRMVRAASCRKYGAERYDPRRQNDFFRPLVGSCLGETRGRKPCSARHCHQPNRIEVRRVHPGVVR